MLEVLKITYNFRDLLEFPGIQNSHSKIPKINICHDSGNMRLCHKPPHNLAA